MFLTWHLAFHLQMSKQSPCSIPRTPKSNWTGSSALLSVVEYTNSLLPEWSHKRPGHLCWPHEEAAPAFKFNIHLPSKFSCKLTKDARVHVHARTHPECVSTCSPAAVQGNIHLGNSACRGYFRGNLLITPSVASQRARAPIHQHALICQSHSLSLVSRVLIVWEFVNSCVCVCECVIPARCKGGLPGCACILCLSIYNLFHVKE